MISCRMEITHSIQFLNDINTIIVCTNNIPQWQTNLTCSIQVQQQP